MARILDSHHPTVRDMLEGACKLEQLVDALPEQETIEFRALE